MTRRACFWMGGITGLCVLVMPTYGFSSDMRVLDEVGAPVEVGVTVRQGERWIEVPGSPVLVRLWQETSPAGETIPYYSISLDGRTYSASRRTSYKILLRHGHFDPLEGVPPVHPRLRAIDDNSIHIVQFVTQPLEAYRRDLSARGATIREFLSNHTYIVEMTPDTRREIASLPYVRWVGAYHPAYKLDEQILHEHFPQDGYSPSGLAAASSALPAGRFEDDRNAVLFGAGVGRQQESDTYNILVFQRGPEQKNSVGQRIREVGGRIDNLIPDGFLLRATLTIDQLEAVLKLNEVAWVDLWGPYEDDMNIARDIGGGNFIESTLGYTGQGLRGEVLDSGVLRSHTDFQTPVLLTHGSVFTGSHGTNTTGIVFGSGTTNFLGRGMLPDAQGITANYQNMSNRYTHTAALVNPNGTFRAVLQSNSWGSARTRSYSSISAQMDDILFINDIVITQSQSNAGNQDSRPQAWAKNMNAVGGVFHRNTLAKSDDCWCGGGSIGPASDGRVKPDYTHFYDSIFTVASSCNSCYTSSFGGTSGATPINAGYMGLVIQMWHEEVFPGFGGAATVFDSRPHMSTTKALTINSADQYPFIGRFHDKTRTHQGWGMADLRQLYNDRNRMFIINETDILQNLEAAVYTIEVKSGEPDFRATLVYTDPKGNPGSSQHRKNDLSLKVTAPNGLVYWGNNGLLDGVWSVEGGAANEIDTVENVFVQNPGAGTWFVEVIAVEIVEDSHKETPEVDADFALVVVGGKGQSSLSLAVGPLRWGQNATLKAVNADPNDTIFFIYSTVGPGSTFVPQLGITLDLKNPVLGGSAVADAGGVATLNKTLPNVGGLMGIWIQAAKVGEKSNLVATFIAP